MNPIVRTKAGTFEGVIEQDCVVFKGIPYAKPPIKDLRFAAPQEPERLEGIYKADHYPNRCPQIDWSDPNNLYKKEFYDEAIYATPLSEDCLYLNIWIPKEPQTQKLPVAFYIHGGGFMGGTGHEKEFRTNAYAKRDIILVSINYRLGVLGFFSHPWVYEEDPIACGNYGILDQLAALKWVGENIEAFGGNPQNITIFGQSAGAMSVQTLLSTPMAKGKFQKAIMQSASGYPSVLHKDIRLEESFETGFEIVKSTQVVTLEELRAVSLEQLLKIQDQLCQKSMQSGSGLVFAPVMNGYMLSDSHNELVAQGRTIDVPTMIGSTRNDITVTEEEALQENSNLQKSCVGWSLAQEKLGREPSYVYFFRRALPGDNAGAFHSSELWYMFGTLEQCWRPWLPEDFILSEKMLDYWTSFMKNGSPNCPEQSKWRPCRSADPYVMVFDVDKK